jgi:hypothetical protein
MPAWPCRTRGAEGENVKLDRRYADAMSDDAGLKDLPSAVCRISASRTPIMLATSVSHRCSVDFGHDRCARLRSRTARFRTKRAMRGMRVAIEGRGRPGTPLRGASKAGRVNRRLVFSTRHPRALIAFLWIERTAPPCGLSIARTYGLGRQCGLAETSLASLAALDQGGRAGCHRARGARGARARTSTDAPSRVWMTDGGRLSRDEGPAAPAAAAPAAASP